MGGQPYKSAGIVMKPGAYFIYWMFDASGRCLYIGRTRYPGRRFAQHRFARPEMIESVEYTRVAGPYSELTSYFIERNEQLVLKPLIGRDVIPDKGYELKPSLIDVARPSQMCLDFWKAGSWNPRDWKIRLATREQAAS